MNVGAVPGVGGPLSGPHDVSAGAYSGLSEPGAPGVAADDHSFGSSAVPIDHVAAGLAAAASAAGQQPDPSTGVILSLSQDALKLFGSSAAS